MIDTKKEDHKPNYRCSQTPSGYKCAKCGKSGVKLWRDYNTFLSYNQLLCCDCAAVDQGKDIDDIDARGCRSSDLGQRTDQIGWYVPAVPTQDGSSYWGYTSVPQCGVDWWRRLSTR